MPLHEWSGRYAKYDPFRIRETPTRGDALEEELADQEASREVDQFLARLSPNFRRRYAVKIAQRVLGDLPNKPDPVEVSD
jgi:hypothetical protein